MLVTKTQHTTPNAKKEKGTSDNIINNKYGTIIPSAATTTKTTYGDEGTSSKHDERLEVLVIFLDATTIQ